MSILCFPHYTAYLSEASITSDVSVILTMQSYEWTNLHFVFIAPLTSALRLHLVWWTGPLFTTRTTLKFCTNCAISSKHEAKFSTALLLKFQSIVTCGLKKEKTRKKCILCNKKVIKLSNFCHKKRSSWETGSTNLSIMRRASNCSTNSILIIAMMNAAHKVWLPTNTVSCVQFSSYLRNSGHGTTFFSLTYLADEPHLANTTNSVARDSLLNS